MALNATLRPGLQSLTQPLLFVHREWTLRRELRPQPLKDSPRFGRVHETSSHYAVKDLGAILKVGYKIPAHDGWIFVLIKYLDSL